MIKSIFNNPYRILGVFSNSPKKEQIANKGKMQAFLRVNKSMPFKLDLQGVLPEIQRTQELVDYADSELALSAGQIKHAQFWFINKTPIDGIAFNHLIDGNIDTAIDLWKKSVNMSSLQNLFICYLIKGDYKTAIVNCAIPLYEHYSKEFVETIDDKSDIQSDNLIQVVVETLSNEGVDLLPISNSILDDNWKKLIEAKKVEPLITKLNSHISEAKSAKDNGGQARLTAGNKLKIASKPLLDTLRNILGKNDTRYQIIADKVAQEVLQCSIDYYNESKDLDSPAKALPLCEYALSIAVGNAAKQRCESNYDTIHNAFENMPPAEVAQEAKEIDSLFTWYRKQKHTSEIGRKLLEKAKNSLISIKEKLGNKNKYYLETSSLLGSAALGYVIDEVNEVQKDDEPDPFSSIFGRTTRYNPILDMLNEEERKRKKAYVLKEAFRNAWLTILYIDLLDKTAEFNQKRFAPNRKTLHSIISSVNGFGYPDDRYIIKGCAHGLSVDSHFLWSDSEHYADCSSKADYNWYLENFPNGNHVVEARQRVAEIEEHEKKVRNNIIIAVAIAVVLFIIIIAANAKGRSSNEPARTEYNSGSSYYYNSPAIEEPEFVPEEPDLGNTNDYNIDNDFNIDNDVDIDDGLGLEDDIDDDMNLDPDLGDSPDFGDDPEW